MHKVSVTIPAPITSLAPGLNCLGLALAMHTHIEMTTRRDDQLEVIMRGEGHQALPSGFQNPVVKAATRLFQQQETAPAGLTVLIENSIPLGIGLDAQTALLVGGLVAANNLIGGDLERDELMGIAVEWGLPAEAVVTAMLGGLNVCLIEEDGGLLYTNLEPPPLRVALVTPDLPDYRKQIASALPDIVSLEDALFNLNRLPFVIDAIASGNFDLLKKVMGDRLYQAAYTAHIPGFEAAQEAALDAGAVAVTLAGNGPSVLAFAPYNHALVANGMVEAFQKAGVQSCRFWTIGIDAQGVTISVAE